jgi:hypothetical protein
MTAESKPWRFVISSVRGSSHVTQDKPCQDWSYCKVHKDGAGKDLLVALVADGAGSAAHSDVGAREICRMFAAEVDEHFRGAETLAQIDRDFFGRFLTYFQNEMSRLAEADEGTVSDFACTFLAALVGENQAVFAQVGDGAIVYSLSGDCDRRQLFLAPMHGEYANMTHFATESDALEHLEYERMVDPIGEVALFTDGIERLALNLQTMQPHAPFFSPMFAPVRQAAGEGILPDLKRSLDEFLDSKSVNSRTDDDKTLILASRCSPLVDATKMEDADEK